MHIQTGVPCKWTNDSQRFLLEHYDTILNCPSQIYYSALPFCPSSSWLHECYAAEQLQAVRVVRGLPAEWGICSRTVLLPNVSETLSYGNNAIAAGLRSGDIIILDAITGGQVAVLSGHTGSVVSVVFSPSGTSLVSGSFDKTIKLWDIQTGGIVNTFYGHTDKIWSVSISSDYTRIASGSMDMTIRLWDTQTGECKDVIELEEVVQHVSFSPIDPGHFIFVSLDTIQQCDINGHRTGPTYYGTHITFSPDHTLFAWCSDTDVTVQNSGSRAIEAILHVIDSDYYDFRAYDAQHCCFSPDSRLVAAAVGRIIYVWDIASSDPHLVQSLVGHTEDIYSLVFSSSSCLVSTAENQSVKFWQIGNLSADPVVPDSASIQSLSLQARAGIVISSDSAGVVKTWDISTGTCKTSYKIPIHGYHWGDAQLIGDRLIFVWHKDEEIHIWDTQKGGLLQKLDAPGCRGLRISGDGSKLFYLNNGILQAWSMWTWKLMGEVNSGWRDSTMDPLCTDNSKIWIVSEVLSTKGWDFGTLGSSPVPLSHTHPDRPYLDLVGGVPGQMEEPIFIKDIGTGKVVFQLPGRYEEPFQMQWDGWYLVAGYESGEVLILDFNHLGSQ